MDPAFEALKGDIVILWGPVLNMTSIKEHLPDFYRMIKVVKERVRAIRSTLP